MESPQHFAWTEGQASTPQAEGAVESGSVTAPRGRALCVNKAGVGSYFSIQTLPLPLPGRGAFANHLPQLPTSSSTNSGPILEEDNCPYLSGPL